jgi:hypothetical protein
MNKTTVGGTLAAIVLASGAQPKTRDKKAR